MEYFIRLISSDAPDQRVKLEQGETLVGRSRSANIRVKNPDVSGKQFLLRLDGEKLTIENLSSNGTRIDDRMLFDNTTIAVGQHIYAGESLECIIEEGAAPAVPAPPVEKAAPAPVPPPPPAVDDTAAAVEEPIPAGKDDTAAEIPIPPPQVIMEEEGMVDGTAGSQDAGTAGSYDMGTAGSQDTGTAGSHDTGTAGSHDTGTAGSHDTGAGTAGGRTAVNRTRVATPAEIEYIKGRKQHRVHQLRIARVVLLVVALVAVGVFFYLNPGKEKSGALTWPQDATGAHSTALSGFEGMDVNKGGFSIYYPKYDSTTVAQSDGVIHVSTRLGAQGEVPLALILTADKSQRNLFRTLSQTMKEWMEERVSDASSRWVFEKQEQLNFLGQDNGLPMLTVRYVREDKGAAWFGLCRLLRHGETAWTLRVEVPFEFRSAAEELLLKNMLVLTNPEFVRRNWSGGVPRVTADWATLKQLQGALMMDSPAQLSRLYRQINGVLIDATITGDKAKQEYAQQLLMQLRDNQRLCFNRMRIKFINARLERNGAAAEKIREESAAIFSQSSDRRYYAIRRNQW